MSTEVETSLNISGNNCRAGAPPANLKRQVGGIGFSEDDAKQVVRKRALILRLHSE
jgi:hypothetical protein